MWNWYQCMRIPLLPNLLIISHDFLIKDEQLGDAFVKSCVTILEKALQGVIPSNCRTGAEAAIPLPRNNLKIFNKWLITLLSLASENNRVVIQFATKYPWIIWGYFARIHAVSIPPYDPPNAMMGLFSAPFLVFLKAYKKSAKSARACSLVK